MCTMVLRLAHIIITMEGHQTCLTKEPEFANYDDAANSCSLIYGTEYHIDNRVNLFPDPLTHFILNELFCHMYWKTPFTI